MKDNIYKIHNSDARDLDHIIKGQLVDVTVTSPPYFDLKDYGHKKQIGFGQDYQTYLNDLKIVFDKVYKVTKDTGTLWVIIDTFRRDGEVLPLPFDFSNKIRECGWKLQDIIIWKKERTVPWAKKGQMRGLIEYILVFSKTKNFKYYLDRIRDFSDLKKWWVKYPERYNPKGKNPSEIWQFDIPTQGSWGNGYVKHFCPLPEELVRQIIQLTTDEGDLVFDPFSGSGTVPAQAIFTKRKYAGFELNKKYIALFDQHVKKNAKNRIKGYEQSKSQDSAQDNFEKKILELRSLKYADVLKKSLEKVYLGQIRNIYINKSKVKPVDKHKLITVEYFLLIKNKAIESQILKTINKLISIPPLSKYGIEAKFSFTSNIDMLEKKIYSQSLFGYNSNSTNKYKAVVNRNEIANFPFLSNISNNIDEKDQS